MGQFLVAEVGQINSVGDNECAIASAVPTRPNHVWSVDFMSDALACTRRFRTLNVIDDFNRQSVHIAVEPSINPARLVRLCAQVKRDAGLAKIIRTDMAPRFTVKRRASGAQAMMWCDSLSNRANRIRLLSLSAATGPFAQTCLINTCLPARTRSDQPLMGG